MLRFGLGSVTGVTGNPKLAELGFRPVGNPGQAAILDVIVQVFESPLGAPIPIETFNGLVCIAPCQNLSYLPAILRGLLSP